MKLYYHPVSTVCRPVLLFAAESGITFDLQLVDLFTGAQYQPEYSCINPSCQVPTLDDGDFRLTECSAILKYLADKVRSPAYPTDPQKRARVNEVMDWFNTGFYREFGYNYVYPQIFPFAKRPDDVSQQVTVNWGRDKGRFFLKVLDECILGPKNRYVCGDQITIADYFGVVLVLTGEAIGCDFAEYPNIRRWIASMKSLKNWEKANEAFYKFIVEPNRGKTFVPLAETKKQLQPA